MTKFYEQSKGPLDIARQTVENAIDFDILLNDRLASVENFDDIVKLVLNEVAELDSGMPFLHERVDVTGIPTTIAMGEDGFDSYVFTENISTPNTEQGEYRGYFIRRITDIDEDEGAIFRLVHGIEVDDVRFTDDFGNNHHLVNMHYYPVFETGSDPLRPLMPINAHSMVDLKNDPALERINNIVYTDVFDNRTQKIRALGKFMRKAMIQIEVGNNSLENINHQRLSYLNSIPVFNKDEKVATSNFIFESNLAKAEDHEVDVSIEKSLGTVRIEPRMLVSARKYFVERSGYAHFSSSQDIYLNGETDTGQSIYCPLKSAVVVR